MKLNNAEVLTSEPLLSSIDMPGGHGGQLYSPILKSSFKSSQEQAVMSRIHCIPLLMLLVFFVLWAASSEVAPAISTTTPHFVNSELDLKMVSEEQQANSQPGGRTVLLHQHASSDSLSNSRTEEAHLRGNARSDSVSVNFGHQLLMHINFNPSTPERAPDFSPTSSGGISRGRYHTGRGGMHNRGQSSAKSEASLQLLSRLIR